MTTAEQVEDAGPVTKGVTVWGPAFVVPIAAWAVHLVVLAGIVRLTCNDAGWMWVVHVTTVVTGAATGVSMLLCLRLLRAGGGDESDPGPAGRVAFLARLGLLIGAFNLLLILVEEIYAIGLHPERCV